MTDNYNLGAYNSADQEGYIKPTDLVIARMVDTISNYEMKMRDAVNFRDMDRLDDFILSPKFANQYLLPDQTNEAARPRSQTIEYYGKQFNLDKFSSEVKATYESSIRYDRQQQIMQTIRGSGLGYAREKDLNIIRAIRRGAGIVNPATGVWGGSSEDIVGDIGGLIDSLFESEKTNISEDDLNRMIIYYPAKVYSAVRDPIKTFQTSSSNNPVTTTKMQMETDIDWARNTYGITWKALHDLNYTGEAIAVIPSSVTADHYTLRNPLFPEVSYINDTEHQVEKWINHRYHGTFIYPANEDYLDVNFRILKLTGVCAKTAYPALA